MAERNINNTNTITAPGNVVADLNNCENLGLYLFNSTTANTPSQSSTYGLCLTLASSQPRNYGIGWICQIAFDTQYTSGVSDNKLFIRKRINMNSWTPWSTIVSS